MPSIGPELPPHLLNRGNTAAEAKNVNTTSIGPQIPSGITLHDDDDVGPSQPTNIGPAVPSNLLKASYPALNVYDDDEDDDFIPPLPPHLLASTNKRPVGPTPPVAGPSTTTASTRRTLGPSLPTYAPTYNPNTFQHVSDDDDDDDDVGPKPLPAGMRHEESDAVKDFIEREEKRRKELEEASKPKAPKRDEWMLVPPSSSDLLGKLDTTKMKPRQFSRSTAAPASTDNSLWTETPAERQQRLADEVLGKKRRAAEPRVVDDDVDGSKKRRRREEEKIRKGVEEHTKKRRGAALVDQHAASGKGEEEKADTAIWDHSRDMALGGRLMDDDKRNKMLREAKGLGDRFGTGKSGGFL